MAKIRSIKPQWLEDERIASCSDAARVMSVAMIALADDHGNAQGSLKFLAARVWGYRLAEEKDIPRKVAESLRELCDAGWCRLYEVKNQSYFNILNWSKHQRISNAGKPLVPPPEGSAESCGETPRNAETCGETPPDKEKEKEKEKEEERGRTPDSNSEQIQNQGLDADLNQVQVSEHEPPTPSYDPEDRTPHQRLCDLVRTRHRDWHIGIDPLCRTPSMGPSYCKQVASVAEHIASVPDPAGLLDLIFEGFGSNERARSKGYPFAFLANNPTEYAKPNGKLAIAERRRKAEATEQAEREQSEKSYRECAKGVPEVGLKFMADLKAKVAEREATERAAKCRV